MYWIVSFDQILWTRYDISDQKLWSYVPVSLFICHMYLSKSYLCSFKCVIHVWEKKFVYLAYFGAWLFHWADTPVTQNLNGVNFAFDTILKEVLLLKLEVLARIFWQIELSGHSLVHAQTLVKALNYSACSALGIFLVSPHYEVCNTFTKDPEGCLDNLNIGGWIIFPCLGSMNFTLFEILTTGFESYQGYHNFQWCRHDNGPSFGSNENWELAQRNGFEGGNENRPHSSTNDRDYSGIFSWWWLSECQGGVT